MWVLVWRWGWRVVVVIGGFLFLSACRSNSDKGVALESGRADTAGTAQTTPTRVNETSLTAASLPGSLVFVDGTQLYHWLPRQEAELLANEVSPAGIFLSPDKTHLIYTTVANRTTTIWRLDIATSQMIQLHRYITPPRELFVFWSPDSAWLMLQSEAGHVVVRTDGTQAQEIRQGFNMRLYWLVDNTVLIVQLASGQILLEQLDPATGIRTAIPLAELVGTLEDQFLAALVASGLQLHTASGVDTSVQIIEPSSFHSRFNFCDTWQIIQQVSTTDEPEIRYEATNVARLANLVVLSDESMLFAQLRYPNCEYRTLTAELVYLQPAASAHVITDELYPGGRLNVRRLSENAALFAISPDERYVVWINGDLERTAGVLYVDDLASGETIKLRDAQNGWFAGVFWVST
jgi:hypothetical protein